MTRTLVAAVAAAALVLLAGAPRRAAACWVALRWRDPRRRLHAAARAELPDLLDLLTLAVGAGRTVVLAIAAVAPRAPPAWRPALDCVLAQVDAGRRLGDALDSMVDAVGDVARPLASTLAATDRYGTPLLPALERLALEARFERRQAVEQASRRLSVLVLFPLTFCTLPALGTLTLVPAVAGAFDALRR